MGPPLPPPETRRDHLGPGTGRLPGRAIPGNPGGRRGTAGDPLGVCIDHRSIPGRKFEVRWIDLGVRGQYRVPATELLDPRLPRVLLTGAKNTRCLF